MLRNSSIYKRSAAAGLVVVTLMACSSTEIEVEQAKSAANIHQMIPAQSTGVTRKNPVAIATFKGHSERVVSVVFSPDGQLIASASYDNTVKLWNPRTSQVIRTFSVEPTEKNYAEEYRFSIESSSKLSFSKDGKILTLGNGHAALISWQIDTGRVVRKLRGRGDYTAATAFSPDGNFFATALPTPESDLTNPKTQQILQQLSQNDLANLNTEQTLQQLSQSTMSLDAGSIRIWSVKTGQQISTIPKTGIVVSVAFSSDNRLLASTNLSGEIHLRDLNSKKLLRQWQGFRAIAISPDAELIAGNDCEVIKVWNRKTGKEIHSLKGIKDSVEALVFSSDSKTLAVANTTANAITMWDLATGQKIGTLSSPQVWSVAISSNSELIASGNFDNTVKVWKMR